MGRMSSRLSRNANKVLNAPVIDGKKTRYKIEGVPGLGVDVWPTGGRNWIFRYQMRLGKERRIQRTMTLGSVLKMSLADAVILAKQLNSLVAAGKDPQQTRLDNDEAALSVRTLIDQFLEKHVAKNLRAVTAQQYIYRLKTFVEPELGDLLVTNVRKRDIIELADGIAEDGKSEKKQTGRGSRGGDREGGAPRLADSVVEIISSMFGWAQKRDMLEHNPAYRVAKYADAARRERVLQDGEFPLFWHGTDIPEVGEKISIVLKLALLTGQRRGEVTGALVSELNLDLDMPFWKIGRERTKNGAPHTVPLAPGAAALFRYARKNFANETYVFPAAREGTSLHTHFGAVTKAMRTVREEFNLEDLTVHDLRRTVRTHMASLKIPREISARVLNHADEFDRGVHDEVYNRYEYFDEKLEALMQWEERVAQLVNPAR